MSYLTCAVVETHAITTHTVIMKDQPRRTRMENEGQRPLSLSIRFGVVDSAVLCGLIAVTDNENCLAWFITGSNGL